MRVASQVIKRLKIGSEEIKKFQQNLKLAWNYSLMSNLLPNPFLIALVLHMF